MMWLLSKCRCWTEVYEKSHFLCFYSLIRILNFEKFSIGVHFVSPAAFFPRFWRKKHLAGYAISEGGPCSSPVLACSGSLGKLIRHPFWSQGQQIHDHCSGEGPAVGHGLQRVESTTCVKWLL